MAEIVDYRIVERRKMKQVEKYLCAQCWQDVVAAGLIHEENRKGEKERKPCDWCGRNCYGSTYRIFYGGKVKK